MPHDRRDEVIDFIKFYSSLTGIAASVLVRWINLSRSKYQNWKNRYGAENQHNARVPRDFWIEDWEREAIIQFHDNHPLEGYRRLTFMMLDRDIVAVSPATVYRVLKKAERIERWNRKPSLKGKGFIQPLKAHEHWHIDIAYINIAATFYYLCSILDGYSRYIVHWEIREAMTEADVEIIIQRARERFPDCGPRIISDNGPQFIAREFKEFIRIAGMTHVKTSPYYPQSNGKIERWHKTIKSECVRPETPVSLEDARKVVGRYVHHYNSVRLHSAICFVTPEDMLAGKDQKIFADRDRKLEAARAARRSRRQMDTRDQSQSQTLTHPAQSGNIPSTGETDAGSAGAQPEKG